MMAGSIPQSGNLQVVFSIDTTGSMCHWLDELRDRIQDMILRLKVDIPGITIAVIAHGDYYDEGKTYVTKWMDFTSDVVSLCNFVKNVETTGGGVGPECYELALRQVRTKLNWTPATHRVLIVIGDSRPHEKWEALNKDSIDWEEETKLLYAEGVTIYGVQCGHDSKADHFFQTISLATQGKHLRLEDFGSLFDTLMAVCYREGHDTAMLATYEKEVRSRDGSKGLAVDINRIFAVLRDDHRDSFTPTTSLPVPATTIGSTGSLTTPVTATTKKMVTHKVKSPSMPRTILTKNTNKRSSPTVRTTDKGLDKYKQSNLPLLKRENVPETNFSLRSLEWTPWILSMVSDGDVPANNKQRWQKQRDRCGYCLNHLPAMRKVGTSSCVLFEVAIQTSGRNRRRHVVFSGFSSHCLNVGGWVKQLLGCKRQQVDSVLEKGCKIYIRYCLVSGQSSTIRKSIQRYDYAWGANQKLRNCGREVIKGGVCISAVG